jgi:hypothetical protein
VDLHLPAEPLKQHRATIVFRGLLSIPAWIISFGLYGTLGVAAILGWFVSLVLGRMPEGLRNVGSYALRYGGQVNAYSFLLTPRYPNSGPHPDPASP